MELDFKSIADDFFVNMTLQTTMALPKSRETVLQFCEAVQREFPAMTNFYQREGGEFVLEADHEPGTYSWLEMQPHRISAGYFNPTDVARAYHLHRWLLNRSVYFLGVSPLDAECLDVLFGFNLDFHGNRDAIVADALLAGSPLGGLLADPAVRPLECEPALVLALDDACCTQAKLSFDTRSSSYQVRTGQYEEEPISVYLTIRRYPSPGKPIDLDGSFAEQCELCEEIACRTLVPNVVQPIAAAIAAAR